MLTIKGSTWNRRTGTRADPTFKETAIDTAMYERQSHPNFHKLLTIIRNSPSRRYKRPKHLNYTTIVSVSPRQTFKKERESITPITERTHEPMHKLELKVKRAIGNPQNEHLRQSIMPRKAEPVFFTPYRINSISLKQRTTKKEGSETSQEKDIKTSHEPSRNYRIVKRWEPRYKQTVNEFEPWEIDNNSMEFSRY